jgi:tetratricopeptide (TPR) repeat protein
MAKLSPANRAVVRALRIGMIHQRAGRIPEAIQSYRGALSLNPEDAESMHRLADLLSDAGELDEAAALFERLLKLVPADALAYFDLGRLRKRRGELQAAVNCYRHAIELRPDCFEFHFNLAGALFQLGLFAESAESYRQALLLEPDDAEAHYSLGVALHESGKLEAAAESYANALRLKSDYAEAFCNLGAVCMELGNLPMAVKYLRHSLAIQPGSPNTQRNLGKVLLKQGDTDAAIDSLRNALTLQPKDAEAHYSLGVALQESGKLEAAAESYANALRLSPEHAEALCNLGVVNMDLGNMVAADFLRRSLAIQPRSADTHCNLGNVLLKQGDTIGAIGAFRNALTLQPDHAATLSNLGFTLETLGDAANAVQCYRRALQSRPDYALAKFFLGMSQLAAGDFAAGLPAYEHRWATKDFRKFRRTFVQPQWRGEDIRGSRILLYAEQGLGDTMQFVRYVPMLLARGAEITLEVQPNVYRLLKNSFGQTPVRIIRAGEALPDFDWQCPLLSLPLAFGTDLASIPSVVPYLHAEAAAAAQWAQRLPANTLRVGLTWGGNPKHSRESQRSIPLQQLARITRIEGATFYSLQKGAAAAGLKALAPELRIIDLDGEQKDFADTAAIAANLDLVISIDTSVLHLAGAIGRPVWILLHNLPDWRWLRGRTTSPWYPTAKLFRQTVAGDWSGVLDQVEESLRTLVNDRGSVAANRRDEFSCASK